VICVNNLTYAMTGGRPSGHARQRHHGHRALRQLQPAFNLWRAGRGAGASYVARWTTFHGGNLLSRCRSAAQAGFCFIEILSPCPTLYQRRNKMATAWTP